MPFERDPLSKQYDGRAGAMITEAIRAYAASPQRRSPLWVRGIFTSPAGDVRETRAPQLTRSERAFQRALYYDERIYHRSPDKSWSLTVDWGQTSGRLGAAPRRLFRIRVFGDTSGARHAEGAGRSYVRNPALRSTSALVRQASSR